MAGRTDILSHNFGSKPIPISSLSPSRTEPFIASTVGGCGCRLSFQDPNVNDAKFTNLPARLPSWYKLPSLFLHLIRPQRQVTMHFRLRLCITLICTLTNCISAAGPGVSVIHQFPRLLALLALPDQDFRYDAAYNNLIYHLLHVSWFV